VRAIVLALARRSGQYALVAWGLGAFDLLGHDRPGHSSDGPVIARHAGGGRIVLVPFLGLCTLLVGPSIASHQASTRWLTLGVILLLLGSAARAARIGRVVMTNEVLKVWTVFRVHRLPVSVISEALTVHVRVGLIGYRRRAFAIRTSEGLVTYKDINTTLDAVDLQSICDVINDRLSKERSDASPHGKPSS
jgi:hypothetical protein